MRRAECGLRTMGGMYRESPSLSGVALAKPEGGSLPAVAGGTCPPIESQEYRL